MNKILHFIVQETFETFQYTCFKSYVGTNSSKAMYEENVRQFKTCVIAKGNLEQMLISSQKLNMGPRKKAHKQKWGHTKVFYPLSHNFNHHFQT